MPAPHGAVKANVAGTQGGGVFHCDFHRGYNPDLQDVRPSSDLGITLPRVPQLQSILTSLVIFVISLPRVLLLIFLHISPVYCGEKLSIP